jgi:endonuclease/exonuclease/phosphatase family metal-dependent hydrolase
MASLVLVLAACSFSEAKPHIEQLTVVSWNVHNLFDGSDNGFEYAEYKNSSGWNDEKYRARLNTIAPALKDENGLGADIVCLIEVENQGVVEAVAKQSGMDYGWAFFAGAPDGAVGLGILSKLPLTKTRTHSFHSPDGTIPRPVAEIWIDTGRGQLVVFACHWKSKLGGEKETEVARRAGAALVARRIMEIEAKSPGTPVIVLGDLNENHNEFERIDAAYPCALMPDTEEAAELIQAAAQNPGPGAAFRDFLVISGQKPPRADSFNAEISALYSPWLEKEAADEFNNPENFLSAKGSFYYQDDWETIDHFLLNAALFDKQGWDYEQFTVASEDPFTNAAGLPFAYNPRTGNGLSDHLPIVLRLGHCP